MAPKDEPTRLRIDNVKTDLKSTSTCKATTATILQELLLKSSEELTQKENVGAKTPATARRRAGTTTTTAVVDVKKTSIALSPKERYILATEVANTTLKNLADALKNPPNPPTQRPSSQSKHTPGDDAPKPTRSRTGHVKSASSSKRPLKERAVSQMSNSPRKPTIRRSSSFSSVLTTGPDAGLLATAECARIAFAYLGTAEATKLIGKDSQELQLENGILALVGKLVTLGLDGLAIKEMKHLKKRLDQFLGHENEVRRPEGRLTQKDQQQVVSAEKESLASLLDFVTIEPASPALPLIVSLQTYALRVISKLNRPRIVEAAWEHLKLSNPSSPANLFQHIANTTNTHAKVARQLESLAQTILALCPNISSSHDKKPLQPSPETTLRLQQLAFKVRQHWWALAKHQGNAEQELLEPFTRCLIAFARRSQLSPDKKYGMAELLYTDLVAPERGLGSISGSNTETNKTLSSLAQDAGMSEQALRWLGTTGSTTSTASQANQTARLIRIATVSLDAFIKDEMVPDLEDNIIRALESLGGSLGGSGSDLDSLFLETHAFRRTATRLLIARSSISGDSIGHNLVSQHAFRIIASSVHFSVRVVGAKPHEEVNTKAQERHEEQICMVSKFTKSIIDSVLACCKEISDPENQWKELNITLQECSHILSRLEEELDVGASAGLLDYNTIQALYVKLSNAYWAVSLQLRKAKCKPEMIKAMQHSIDLVHSRSQEVRDSGYLTMKFEQLGDIFESLDRTEKSRNAFRQCIRAYIDSNTSQLLQTCAAKQSLLQIFDNGGPLTAFARVLKSHHRSFLKPSSLSSDELAFFDDPDLGSEVRGAILEWQLSLYIRTLSKNRQWDSNLNSSIIALIKNLQQIYVPEVHPIRRLRLLAILLQFSQSHADILPMQAIPLDILDKAVEASGSKDEGLANFGPHLKALCMLKISIQKDLPPVSTLRECFSTWESLVSTTKLWEAFIDRVDDTEGLILDIKASVEFLNAKGEEYLALPVLHLLVKIGELQKDSDASSLVTNLCALGLQFLRLGYTGKAGLSFAKAEALLGSKAVEVEAKLRWHIAYAEYLARIGNTAKGTIILATAQKIALGDQHISDLAKSSTALSGRLRLNKILADAAYVHSLLASVAGCYRDAAKHAKQCVALNRRIWAALESRANAKKATDGSETDVDESSKPAFDPLSSMRNEKGAPLVTSVTHAALNGADFWSLVPTLYRGLMQHSQVFAYQGLLHEAIYVAEQAEKIASATKSPTLMTDNASWRADCWAQSGRPDKARPILDSLGKDMDRKCLSIVGYRSAVARVHHWEGQYQEEATTYSVLDQLLQDLTSPIYIKSLDSFLSDVDTLAEQMSQMTVDVVSTQTVKTATTTRGRKPAIKSTQQTIPKPVSKSASKARSKATLAVKTKTAPLAKVKAGTTAPSEVSCSTEQCSILHTFHIELMHRGVLANLLQDDLTTASTLLAQIEEGQDHVSRDLSHVWATFKMALAQGFKQIAENFDVNTLPESTIAFPAISLERRLSDDSTAKRTALASSRATKSNRGKTQPQEDFAETLQHARDRLVEAHTLSATNGPNYMFQQISMALGTVTVLLSAFTGGKLGGSLHPLYAAYMGEVPKSNALRLMQESIESEKEHMSRDECLQWPTGSPSTFVPSTVADFQNEYIDIIPKTWTAISLALNDMHDELYITRYESGSSPFLLRLPLARHASRDMDEEEFSFEDGKRDFDEIIELSDFSTRTAKDMTSKEARQQWWTEREALDTRLQELLLNMENIWLGGFKGVFSQHERQQTQLARFRKSLDNILNRHLPSRRKKTQQKRSVLDTKVLELFVGLGDTTNEELDLDEALMDLIYFVVDILHFNGERNAYDEIDFDAMVVETQEALCAYHSGYHQASQAMQHMILILDNNLHGFPWESLPCLEKLSISRLPSLAALRERLSAARASFDQQNLTPGHHIQAEAGGASILNPSGDLSHTLKTLKPRLDELQGSWTHIANRAPSEKEFEDSLREKDLLLYFGHGSGAQFVRSKTVRRLYPGQQDECNKQPGCATTFLFGCSSVHLTENGIYEPSGMLTSYLTAGAPAVVGMLWDVTDKDCDRFAVKAGELWGLWPEPQEEIFQAAPPKTPGRKTKGKSRVAQLVNQAEGGRGPGSAKKGKKTKNMVDHTDLINDRRRGLGLDECVKEARKVCVLRYLNGAAAVMYGIPVYLE
ncbi:peptidase family C50-domain-containing protein [Phaeosphaeriaceae sp. PMI808]|nr:peptidase family C50-domain-containing protein [Phaeosphaeriaceae sp. PMI808]